jgi:hypothetical protein
MEKGPLPYTELTAARLKRKSIDKEAQSLQNKIFLLKHAENRALKSSERKKRLAEVNSEAQLNKLEKIAKKEAFLKLKEEETLKKIHQAQKNREKNKSFRDTISKFLQNRAQHEAQSLKQEREKHQQMIKEMKRSELEQKKILSSQVKKSVHDAQERRKKILDDRISKVKSETRFKIAEEFQRIREKEKALERLEKEQFQLIDRLNLARPLSSSEEVDSEATNHLSFKYKVN